MERRVYLYIMHPSAILVWISGLYLAHVLGIYGWLIIKFIFVILLSLYHINLGRHLKDLSNDINVRSSKFFRLINEIPFLILFFILILVIIKPEIYWIKYDQPRKKISQYKDEKESYAKFFQKSYLWKYTIS